MALNERTRVILGLRRALRRGEPCGSSSQLFPKVACLRSSPQLQLAGVGRGRFSQLPGTHVNHRCLSQLSVTAISHGRMSQLIPAAPSHSRLPQPPGTAVSLTRQSPPSPTASHQRPLQLPDTEPPQFSLTAVCPGRPSQPPVATIRRGWLPLQSAIAICLGCPSSPSAYRPLTAVYGRLSRPSVAAVGGSRHSELFIAAARRSSPSHLSTTAGHHCRLSRLPGTGRRHDYPLQAPVTTPAASLYPNRWPHMPIGTVRHC
jgi:hypothetical protein